MTKKGQCPPCAELFFIGFQLFSPDRIKAIRKALKETREEFAQRFFVSEEAVKSWETPEGKRKHRELNGPAARLMLAVEAQAVKKRNEQNRILKRIIKRKQASLKKQYAWVAQAKTP